jgi:hypothetical protein
MIPIKTPDRPIPVKMALARHVNGHGVTYRSASKRQLAQATRVEAPLVRRGLIVDGFDRDLDGLATDGNVDLDRFVSEVHLMAAAIAAANDREAHLVPPLALGVSSHSLSFDQRRSDWPPRTAIPTALR